MKKLLFLALFTVLMVPAQLTFACEEECVPRNEATEETPAEDICPSRGVPVNPVVMRNAMLQNYINKLEAVGGVYAGGNRFDVMRQIFEIKQAAKGNR